MRHWLAARDASTSTFQDPDKLSAVTVENPTLIGTWREDALQKRAPRKVIALYYKKNTTVAYQKKKKKKHEKTNKRDDGKPLRMIINNSSCGGSVL